MTLAKGDHLVIKRGGKLVEGEAYHEFEVIDLSSSYGAPDAVFQIVVLRKIE